MKKYRFVIQYFNIKTHYRWEEDFECRAWTDNGAIKKALHRGYVVLQRLNRTNRNIAFRPCGVMVDK